MQVDKIIIKSIYLWIWSRDCTFKEAKSTARKLLQYLIIFEIYGKWKENFENVKFSLLHSEELAGEQVFRTDIDQSLSFRKVVQISGVTVKYDVLKVIPVFCSAQNAFLQIPYKFSTVTYRTKVLWRTYTLSSDIVTLL